MNILGRRPRSPPTLATGPYLMGEVGPGYLISQTPGAAPNGEPSLPVSRADMAVDRLTGGALTSQDGRDLP